MAAVLDTQELLPDKILRDLRLHHPVEDNDITTHAQMPSQFFGGLVGQDNFCGDSSWGRREDKDEEKNCDLCLIGYLSRLYSCEV